MSRKEERKRERERFFAKWAMTRVFPSASLIDQAAGSADFLVTSENFAFYLECTEVFVDRSERKRGSFLRQRERHEDRWLDAVRLEYASQAGPPIRAQVLLPPSDRQLPDVASTVAELLKKLPSSIPTIFETPIRFRLSSGVVLHVRESVGTEPWSTPRAGWMVSDVGPLVDNVVREKARKIASYSR